MAAVIPRSPPKRPKRGRVWPGAVKGFTLRSTLDAKPQAVFDVLADVDGAKQWIPEIQDIRRVTDGPLGVGSTWIETRRSKDGKRTFVTTIRVTEFTPGEAFAIAVDEKRATMAFRFGLVQKGKGTEVTYEAKGRLKGLFAPFSGKLVKAMESEDADILQRLGEQARKAGAKGKTTAAKAATAAKAGKANPVAAAAKPLVAARKATKAK